MLLVALMLLTSIPFSSLAADEIPEGYTGISSIEELYSIRYALDGKFILLNDIDMTDATAEGGDWDTNGCGWMPIGDSDAAFTGEFDGNGHKLIGLQIRDCSIEYVGLFGYLNGATIKNLVLESPQVSSTKTYTGTLCGLANGATIESVKITDLKMYGKRNYNNEYTYFGGLCGYINETDISKVGMKNVDIDFEYSDRRDYRYNYYIGGIVGYNKSDSKISQSYITGNMDVVYYQVYSYSGSSYRRIYIGGILGYDNNGTVNNRSTISNCYSATDIAAKSSNYDTYIYVGGILGYGYPNGKSFEIKNCINLGTITANAYRSDHMSTGAIYGHNSAVTLSGNYYLRGTAPSGQYNTSDSAATAIALSEAQMKLQSVFGSLDFNDIWFMDTNSGVNHPQLKDNWEADTPDSLTVISQPDKTTYYHYDDIDLTGLEVQVKYSAEGEAFPLKVTKDMLSEYNADTLGIHEIIISYLGQSTSFKIFVVERPVESVSLDKTEVTLDVGKTQELAATVLPEKATNKSVTWSSTNEDVATVDQNGVITAIGKGTAEIKCVSSNNISASCKVTVLLPANTMEIESACTINKDETKKLTLTVDPSDTTDTFTWKSNDKKIATVDENGVVTGIERGSTFVTVTSSRGLMATCVVTVLTPATQITLSSTTQNIDIRKTAKLTFTCLPTNTTDTFEWSSKNDSIATISEDGVITAVSQGTTTVYCSSSSGLVAACTVKVVVPATSVVLNNQEIKIEDNQTVTLLATVLPENADNKNVTWGSEDESIAKINEYGVVSVVGTGKTRVYAELHTGVRAYCTVEAVINPTSISFDEAEITVLQQSTKTLKLTFAPDKALTTVTYTSSAPEIASVDAKGIVTGLSEGMAIITATSLNGRVSASCTVNVPHKHIFRTINAVPATHYEIGNIKYYQCTDCQKYFSDSLGETEIQLADTVLSIIPHSYPSAYSKDSDGHWKECSCGDKKDYGVHTYGEWSTVTEPTCTAQGKKSRTCSVCGYVEYEPISALNHKWDTSLTVDKLPTCTATGSQSRHCSRCSAKTDVSSIPANGHVEVIDRAVSATCDTDGKTTGKHCSVCGAVTVAQTIIPAFGHTDEDDDGYCDVCGEPSEEFIELGEIKEICVDSGEIVYLRFVPEFSGTYYFTSYSDEDTYGYIYNANKSVISSNDDGGSGQNFYIEYDLKAGTKYYFGAKYYSSRTSGFFDVELVCLEAICDHENIEIDDPIDPTCTDVGFSEGSHCADCGEVIVEQSTIAALGHSYTSKVTQKATCSETGVRRYTCSRCGNSYTKSIEKTAHTYKSSTTKATMEKNGAIVSKCTVCGYVNSSTTIKKISSVTISNSSYSYDGNVKTPTVTVKNSDGNKLVKDTDYTVKYSSGRKNIGTYKVTVKFIGKYSGEKELKFKIVLGQPKISAKQTTSTITLSWNKVNSATGYRVYKYDSKTEKFTKVATIKSGSKLNYKFENLKAGTVYKFKVQAYKKAKDKTIYSQADVFKTATKPEKTKINSLTVGKTNVKIS